jgi:hypothetical protein
MPKPNEVQAALDVLYLSKNLNWEFEQRMWAQAKSKMDYTLTIKRYLAEFDFRYNERMSLGVSDEARTTKALSGIVGKRLTYRDSSQW